MKLFQSSEAASEALHSYTARMPCNRLSKGGVKLLAICFGKLHQRTGRNINSSSQQRNPQEEKFGWPWTCGSLTMALQIGPCTRYTNEMKMDSPPPRESTLPPSFLPPSILLPPSFYPFLLLFLPPSILPSFRHKRKLI